MVRKPTPGKWRMTLDFIQLNGATRGLKAGPFPAFNKQWLDWAPSNPSFWAISHGKNVDKTRS